MGNLGFRRKPKVANSARSAWQSGLALLGVIACGSAAGQQPVHPALQDRFSIQIGAYAPNIETTASLNSATGARGTSISFEDELNLTDRKTVPAILASLRLGERWRIEGEYFSLNRSGSRAIARTLDWGGNTYAVGTTVTSEFDSDIFRFSVGYSFVKDNQKEVGVVLGLHATDFSISLAAPTAGARTGDGLAPLPVIGVYGAYAFTPKWLLSGRLDYFSMNYNEYDGSLVNFNIGVDYRFSRHFGVGLSYRHVDYDVTATKANFNGGMTYKFSGPMIYGVASF
jgi:hypothetical protein